MDDADPSSLQSRLAVIAPQSKLPVITLVLGTLGTGQGWGRGQGLASAGRRGRRHFVGVTFQTLLALSIVQRKYSCALFGFILFEKDESYEFKSCDRSNNNDS